MEQRRLEDLKARRAEMARIRKAKQRRAMLATISVILSVVLVIGVVVLIALTRYRPLVDSLTVEAGSVVEPERFLAQPGLAFGSEVYYKSNMAAFDMSKEGDYTVEIYVNGKAHTTIMRVRDTVPPTADPVEMTINAGLMPAPEFLVTNVRDVGLVSASYQVAPDVSKGGKVVAQVKLTDEAGNSSVIAVTLTIIDDTVPPEVQGATDRTFYVGDPIVYTGAYKDQNGNEYPEVLAVDDKSEATLSVDRDAVDTEKAGTYPVIYTAKDAAGNEASVTVQFTLVDKPEGYVEPDVVYGLAQEVLDEITTEGMSKMEVAFAIYRWTSRNIGYVGSSDKSSWTGAAYQAFTEMSGDCYNYFAAAKALFDVAGIPNVDVVKSDTSRSHHYWSLIDIGGGWYHVDCTPRSNPGKFFMNTDAELEAYSVKNKNSHIFDGSLYPDRATESVQDMVDYAKGQIIEN